MFKADTVVGSVTSAAWGHRVGRNLAMAFVDPQEADIGNRLDVLVLVLGQRLPPVVCERCLHDPEDLAPRS